MATIQDLGKVAYLNKGNYDENTNYEINDVVSYNGSSYVSLVNDNKGNVPTNTNFWSVVAQSAYEIAVQNGYEGTAEEWTQQFLNADNYYNKAEINTKNNNLQSQINSLASGSPLVANSTSGMTDTTRVYVNTTDGHWYWYNGTTWADGGTYQSTGIEDESINKYMLDSNLKNAIYKSIGANLDLSNDVSAAIMKSNDGSYFTGGVTAKSLIIPIESNTKYIVHKIASTRFALYLSENYPASRVTITNYVQNNTYTALEITSGASDEYLTILYYNPNSDTLTEEEIKNSLKVYKNSVEYDKTQAEYLENKINNVDLLSDRYIKLISTKYLGQLTKGYIAISSDDGTNALADITIDLFKGYKTTYNKNIPLTMGLMSTSQIFADNTRKAKVLDLINNYGSSVAIHGNNPYTTYTDEELFDFLDEQKEYITNNLSAPTSIIFPNHSYNEKTSTISGSYFGVCCTGGSNNPISYGGNSKCAGPRSNMYTLYRFSLFNSEMTTQKIKNAIDYAYEHNMIFLPFFHDNNLTNDYERCKALLDYCVDYANSKGLDFINVGDIPNII